MLQLLSVDKAIFSDNFRRLSILYTIRHFDINTSILLKAAKLKIATNIQKKNIVLPGAWPKRIPEGRYITSH